MGYNTNQRGKRLNSNNRYFYYYYYYYLLLVSPIFKQMFTYKKYIQIMKNFS